MPNRRLNKSTLAHTLRFDSDRFLRFELASAEEKSALGLSDARAHPPGIQLITTAGKMWEIDRYDDLLIAGGPENVRFQRSPNIDARFERRPFNSVEDLAASLRRETPPLAIIEGEFVVPGDLIPHFEATFQRFGLEVARCRPDIIWIRRAPTNAPLMGAQTTPQFELHVVDVKMTAEPTLRHFAEVTYYVLALQRWLEVEGLSDRYAVSAIGLIWPGSHEPAAFLRRFRTLQNEGASDPFSTLLAETLIPVPHEVYQPQVQDFFERRLPTVLLQQPEQVVFHVSPTCQLCDYLSVCLTDANQDGHQHLSRIPWLTRGQADVLRANGIASVEDLERAIRDETSAWENSRRNHHLLRADEEALRARTRALVSTDPVIAVPDRMCGLMPQFVDMRIYLTIHFDPGSGITFAVGARCVYWEPDQAQTRPVLDEAVTYIVDRMDEQNPATERARLIEFGGRVLGWLNRVDTFNSSRGSGQRKATVHFFVWDALELRQLRRMFQRHLNDAEVQDLLEDLIRLFPPDDVLPDPDAYRSQPGSVVKEVVRQLVGLRVAHNYTLLEVAECYVPQQDEAGNVIPWKARFGFRAELTDQIPPQRAYELWRDRIILRKRVPDLPNDQWPVYERGELIDELRRSVRRRVDALSAIERRLRADFRDRLTMKKPPFRLARARQLQAHARGREMATFRQLNAITDEIEKRNIRYLPAKEREARFHSMIDLRALSVNGAAAYHARIDIERPDFAARQPRYAFSASPDSRDTRIDTGDFLLALSRESDNSDMYAPWRHVLGLDWQGARNALRDVGFEENELNWNANAALSKVLRVMVLLLDATPSRPVVVLTPADSRLFQMALDQHLVDLDVALALDPIFEDYETRQVVDLVRQIGR